MQKALAIIRDEHHALGAMLQALRSIAAEAARAATASHFESMRAILFYIDEFPERLHHRKESEVLFPLLRLRTASAEAVLARLDAEHERGEALVRALAHSLLAFEQLGEPRKASFLQALEDYARFYSEHMRIEETEVLPLAAEVLTPGDWAAIDEAFDANRDPLTGAEPEAIYRRLFERIVSIVPAPWGLATPRS